MGSEWGEVVIAIAGWGVLYSRCVASAGTKLPTVEFTPLAPCGYLTD